MIISKRIAAAGLAMAFAMASACGQSASAQTNTPAAQAAVLVPTDSDAAAPAPATPVAPAQPLARHYVEGQKLAFHMDGQNEDWKYSAEAYGLVKQDAGKWVEEFVWTSLVSGGSPVPLGPQMAGFRQRLSLDPRQMPGPPDLTQVDPRMIGPITDLMTFYVDIWLANMMGAMHKAGDHFYFANFNPASTWADGKRVLLGETAVDFDMTLKSLDAQKGLAVLEVKHVPPAKQKVQLKAEWMKNPVGDKPNNWVSVSRGPDGTFLAAVGQETFDVLVTISTVDGRIVAGTMENPVKTLGRVCKDEALTDCGEANPHLIVRRVAITGTE